MQGAHIKYHDWPNETHTNGSFKADQSLIGDSKGIEHGNRTYAPDSGVSEKGVNKPIFTLTYGFSVKNGVMTIDPIKVVNPSLFQKQIINQIP